MCSCCLLKILAVSELSATVTYVLKFYLRNVSLTDTNLSVHLSSIHAADHRVIEWLPMHIRNPVPVYKRDKCGVAFSAKAVRIECMSWKRYIMENSSW